MESSAKNAIRIISALNAYYGDNAYCVRVEGVLEIEQIWMRCRYLQQVKFENCRFVKHIGQ